MFGQPRGVPTSGIGPGDGGSEVDQFDSAGYVVRARHRAQLSQREMADHVGVAQSTLGGYEAGARKVPAHLLDAILAVAGLRLAVVDASGRVVEPFSADAVRDNAGRRFPAHLEVQPPDRLPREALRAPRYDRRPPKAWYHLRGSHEVDTTGPDRLDHPTQLELAARQRSLRTAGARRLKALREERAASMDRAQEGEGDGD